MELNKYITSSSGEVKRSEIILAAYNPRKITAEARKKLKANIKRIGIIGGLIWNKTTGNLLAGHQRISILDELNRYDSSEKTDYLIRLDIVELDAKTEIEQNIFLNSRSVQGEYDNEMLGSLLSDIDYDLAGLDEMDLNMIAAESPAFDFGSNEETKAEIKEMERPYEERKQIMKDMKAQQKEAIANKFQGDPYFTLSFDSVDNKAEFLERFGFDPSSKFIKGEILGDKING